MSQNNFFVTTEDIKVPYKGINKKIVSDISREICYLLNLNKVSITIVLTSDNYIHQINRDYRSKDRPTDVISFAYREERFPGMDKTKVEELGDIYLSLEKAYEQSIEYEVTMLDEVKRLLVHSILHLIGFDHERSKKDEKIMRLKEDEILTEMN